MDKELKEHIETDFGQHEAMRAAIQKIDFALFGDQSGTKGLVQKTNEIHERFVMGTGFVRIVVGIIAFLGALAALILASIRIFTGKW